MPLAVRRETNVDNARKADPGHGSNRQDLSFAVPSPSHGIAANETQTNSTSFLAKTCRFANAGGAQAHFF